MKRDLNSGINLLKWQSLNSGACTQNTSESKAKDGIR